MRALIVAAIIMLAGCSTSSPKGDLQDLGVPLEQVELPKEARDAIVAAGGDAEFLLIQGEVIEILVDGAWVTSHDFRYEEEVRVPRAASATEGGGQETRLPIQDLELTLRLGNASALQYETSWVAVSSAGEPTFLGNITASEPLNVTLPMGAYEVAAALMDGNDLVAITNVTFSIRPSFHWTVYDGVRPLNPGGAVPMSESDRLPMADRFVFTALPGATIQADTVFDGTYQPTMGTDVDLEILGPAGSFEYVGAGGGGGQTPDPAQATETLGAQAIQEGDHTVRVGYVSTACGGCFYHNVGQVPYRADILLSY